MSPSLPDEVTQLLLVSMSRNVGDDGLRHAFMVRKPGAPLWLSGFGTDVYFSESKLVAAAAHLRRHGPAYLRLLDMPNVQKLLTDFATDHYYILANEVLFYNGDGDFSDITLSRTKEAMSYSLSLSRIFKPESELTLFPLVGLRVKENFDSSSMFLVDPDGISEARLPPGILVREIQSSSFPPLRDWEGRRHAPTAWLGVRAPELQAAEKFKSTILGALALTPQPRQRHLFSERDTFGGRCTITDTATVSFGEPHMPSMMHDIVVERADHEWLDCLRRRSPPRRAR